MQTKYLWPSNLYPPPLGPELHAHQVEAVLLWVERRRLRDDAQAREVIAHLWAFYPEQLVEAFSNKAVQEEINGYWLENAINTHKADDFPAA